MRSRFIACTALAVVLSAASARADQPTAEVIHWWTSGGEAAAVKVFADSFNKAGGKWVDTAIAGGGGENARSTGISRIVGGKPPTAMQFNYGKQFDEIVANGYVANVDAVAQEGKWKDLLPPVLYNSVVREGHVYGVPVNVHGIHWAWWSAAALQKAGAEAPKSWDDFFPVLDKLKAAGLTPVALGGQAWQEEILFNFIVNSYGGKDLFRAIYVDHKVDAVKSPEFRKAVDLFLKLKPYVDEGSPGRNWNDATAMVITGKAGVQVMGDWAKGEFNAAKQTAGKDYVCEAGFGTKGGYAFGGDVFVMVKSDAKGAAEAQALLAKTLLSPEVQVAFNNVKGSIPVRPDVDTSKVDACAKIGLEAMKNLDNQIPNLDFTNTPDQVGAYRDAITEMWNSKKPDVDAFLAKYAKAVAM
jgi:glucose/mannose transport system substrate-binding protein